MERIIEMGSDLLKAAGTPMMTPLPCLSSFDRFTLLPGESSTSSRSGIRSPTLTIAGLVGWRARVPTVTGAEATKRRVASDLQAVRCIIFPKGLIFGEMMGRVGVVGS